MVGEEQLIREYVDRFEQKHAGPSIYAECLEDMGHLDLGQITEEEIRTVIQPFLYRWGRMGRVLNQDEFKGWQSRLAMQIRAIHEKLSGLEAMQLQTVSLIHSSPDTIRCYESLEEAVKSPIAVVKVLHLICPDFFPLWDNRIREAVIAELADRSEDSYSVFAYYCFMQAIQDFVTKYDEVLSELAEQYRKGKLKIVDEALWASRRPVSFLF
ncbi:MAG: hypothetical protein A2Y72_02460 [Chloroflexi bacterium RBG_13_53_26]|nr:MAG: hypothetical protein A2Y72_02460 [Chloroflexi bacterium RBG_13_53_26]